MDTAQLIKENNRKRKLLTKENELYYSDMLVYIRLQLLISEEKTEEILVELLDHLLDGQKDGKTAEEIFGEDPRAYADEIIAQLPLEERKSIVSFLASLAIDLVSWALMIRGIIYFLFSQVREVDTTVHLFKGVGTIFIIAIVVIYGVFYILKMVKESLFQEDPAQLTVTLKGGIFGAAAFLFMFISVKLLPDSGPTFDFPWWQSFGLGAILWLLAAAIKKVAKK